MLNYKQLICEEPAYRVYHAIIGTLAVKEERPLRVCRIDSNKRTTFVFITQGVRKIKTYKAEIDRIDAPFFTSWLADDFPGLKFDSAVVE